MAISFPNNPALGETYLAANGVTYEWLGYWRAQSTGGAGLTAEKEAEIFTAIGEKIPLTQKGTANGVCPLDSNSRVPLSAMPEDFDVPTVTANFEVTVGTGGDYATINQALSALSERRPAYNYEGIKATVRLLSGFYMREQVFVHGLDMAWVTIVGDDPITMVERAKITSVFTAEYGSNLRAIFGVKNGGKLPVIQQLFEVDNSSSVTTYGVLAIGAASSASVLSGFGVRKAGIGACAYDAAVLQIRGADFTGSLNRGASAQFGGIINAYGAKLRMVEGVDGSNDIRVDSGGIISCRTAEGGTNTPPNQVNFNGIIFQ
jgi:hypothetical protein